MIPVLIDHVPVWCAIPTPVAQAVREALGLPKYSARALRPVTPQELQQLRNTGEQIFRMS